MIVGSERPLRDTRLEILLFAFRFVLLDLTADEVIGHWVTMSKTAYINFVIASDKPLICNVWMK